MRGSATVNYIRAILFPSSYCIDAARALSWVGGPRPSWVGRLPYGDVPLIAHTAPDWRCGLALVPFLRCAAVSRVGNWMALLVTGYVVPCSCVSAALCGCPLHARGALVRSAARTSSSSSSLSLYNHHHYAIIIIIIIIIIKKPPPPTPGGYCLSERGGARRPALSCLLRRVASLCARKLRVTCPVTPLRLAGGAPVLV